MTDEETRQGIKVPGMELERIRGSFAFRFTAKEFWYNRSIIQDFSILHLLVLFLHLRSCFYDL